MTDSSPRIVKPKNKIKQKMGPAADARALLSEEAVTAAQNIIDSKEVEFLEWSQQDIAQLKQGMQTLKEKSSHTEALSDIIDSAENLRDRGGMFGYQLVSLIAKSLVNYASEVKSVKDHHPIVIGKHIESLTIVFQSKIKGDGGMTGVELTSSLQRLVKKYPVA